jgi:glycosyltransferase involved in cell wall biosynthesis
MGLKGDYVHIPHFVNVKEYAPFARKRESFEGTVYWGRISEEKGVRTLVEAMRGLPFGLTIIGEGPLKKELEDQIWRDSIANVTMLPYMNGEDLYRTVSNAAFSVLPSQCYEVFGMVIPEAYAFGLPVIGSKIGGIPELIKENETGLLFEPRDRDGLRDRINYLSTNPDEVLRMGSNARRLVEKEYGEEPHYDRLIKVYEAAVRKRKKRILI